MKIRAKVKNNQLNVKVRFASSEGLNTRELEILTGISVRGLPTPRQTRRTVIEYTGPSGLPMCEYLKRTSSKYDFYYFMAQTAEAVKKVRAGNLFINRLVLDLRYVYVNEGTKELQFLYAPVQSGYPGSSPEGFMEAVMYAVKPGEDVGSSIARFADFIRTQKTFDPDAVEIFIAGEDAEVGSQIQRYRCQSGYFSEKTGETEEDDEDTALMDSATELMEEETGFLEKETTDFHGDRQIHFASLIRCISRERIEINKQVFRLGKGVSCVDYHVDNTVVSRSHADIVTRDGRYYVCDQNSMNHTYINDAVLPAKIETEIHDGDLLRLADEEFEFHI